LHFWLLIGLGLLANAQDVPLPGPASTLRLHVRHESMPVPAATVTASGITTTTNDEGIATLTVAAGTVLVTIVKERLTPVTLSLTVAPGEQRDVNVELEPQAALEEEVIVSATRTDTRLEDQPMRVEVLGREEIEEKLMMTPGDIVMMLNELGGMRVQATSPSLGAASVRIQGMRGRYTRFLADGLPLFGEQVGALGLLQIPPMDLGRVEVIKGVASSLYGAGAMGGVVNLVSRRPGASAEREVLVNRSTRGATDAVTWLGGPLSGKWGATLLAGGHWHQRSDVDDDGWADLPAYTRAVVRPRLFWDDRSGRSLFATAGMTIEDRSGGTLPGQRLPATGQAYEEALDTVRFDVGAVAQTVMASAFVVSVRGAAVQQRHDHRFGERLERDRHNTAFGEVAVRGHAGMHTWVAGAALEHERYRPRDLPQFAYSYTVPGAFAQDDIAVARWLSLSGSARVDRHSEFGTFFSPRVAALLRFGHWQSRLSVGTGFYGPSPLTEETEAAGLSRLSIAGALRAEKGRSASLDLTRTAGPVSVTATFFASRVVDPINVERDDAFVLENLSDPVTNVGIELLATVRREPFSLTATYGYVRARETVGGSTIDVPLTPRHSAGVVGMWEREDVGRVGVEWYYTGAQRLEANPFRTMSKPYAVVGVLAERKFGPIRLFVNGENLTGVRQTLWDPLLRPTRSVDGRWTVDAWAPLDGRNINGGVRAYF
jgi:outer membrane receptor for ferrienterochelin and colicins